MEKIVAKLISKKITSNSPEAHNLHSSKKFGEKIDGKIIYLLSEALFLFKNKKMEIEDHRGKKLSEEALQKKFEKIDKKFKTKYFVFRDLRKKGYIVKTALKFGAEFRVYDQKNKAKKSHSKWILFPISETDKFTWHEFSAKNRIAHSTKKNLLIAIVDDEGDVSYYNVNWMRP